MEALTPDVAIIGGGPSGLSAAAVLARRGLSTLVLEREPQAGGIPRHSDHPGYGLRDRRRLLSGPRYAQVLREDALAVGANVMVDAMVTAVSAERELSLTCPGGLVRVRPRSLILATGARERARAARLVPGDRPPGVITTGQLQQMVHLQGRRLGGRAVVVGAELVSWSAVLTLRHAGVETVLMCTEGERAEAGPWVSAAGRLGLRVSVSRRTAVARVIGDAAGLRGVEVTNLETGRSRRVDCEWVVFTGDWVGEGELARSAGAHWDRATGGPLVDGGLRTSLPGVFAIGNLVHPVDTADVAALDGRHVADRVVDFVAFHVESALTHGNSQGLARPSDGPRVRVVPGDGLSWVSPGVLNFADPQPARGRILAWPQRFVSLPVAIAQQGERQVRARLARAARPGRVLRLPATLLTGFDPAGGPITLTLN
jgi:thioredoxin reductase